MEKNYAVDLKNISKEYNDVTVLNDINLYIRKNEFLTLLGPSGCGKTTTLRIIGGFEQPTEGKVIFEGKDITEVPPYKRQINTVFQKYALFPHMDIFDNIAFGLKIKKISNDEISKRVKEMLRLVNLQGFENRSIDSLSGGQQQRVAIARALVNEPKVLLLDEPLGALDLKLRKDMQIELKNMQKRVGITFIYVTHDQEEALTMSDTIVVMDKGVIQQIGTPVDIYNEPKNAFVAKFIGESNIVDGIMHEDFLVEFCGKINNCVDKGFEKNEKVDVVIRPEDLEIVRPEDGMLKGKVTSVTFKGVHYEMIAKSEDTEWMIHSTIMKPIDTIIGMNVSPENIHIMKKVRE
ncbi:ABC transporter ATP-binding protein [Tissierella sp. MSJ-40]|uniref:Spermidine/putrescine import ATP-binding protein PotA n=1 Tax=Tissierella simiarum TaxID=2841534 RepID=A0ABS6ECU5_9FIRM|nr:spermidine/putrescine ABC transporter ATP-binding protein [Tissierella simiarum]MBU5440064.1 ABC transporter ATP-binding protein [Tissierella simiarum]